MTMTQTTTGIIAGVDTHKDTHYAAVITTTGQQVGAAQFSTSPKGLEALRVFITSFGPLQCVGVEGTNSYGAGLARHFHDAGLTVVEVLRPSRQVRRMNGKSDEIDAYAAAHQALAHHGVSTPKTSDSTVEAIRVVQAARTGAVKAHADALRQIKSLLITAPTPLRADYAHLCDQRLITALATCRPHTHDTAVAAQTRQVLHDIARRAQLLHDEVARDDQTLKTLITQTNPALLQARGVGVASAAQLLIAAGDNPQRIHSEAAFAMMCGVAPIPASSGLTTHHRLNRGGNRDANSALYHIAIVRLSCDPKTRAYAARRQEEGKTKKDVIRCLKRAIAREVYHLIINPPQALDTTELRQLRQDAGLTLGHAADAMGCSIQKLSGIERGHCPDREFITTYHRYLTTLDTPRIAA